MSKKVRVRIAPSPTGDPHVGTAYIALFNWVFAKKNGGDFIIRIEDTDRTRFNEKSEREILEYLKWLGLDWSEGPDLGGKYGPYKQSERAHIYREYVDKLLSEGKAYRCFCSEDRLRKLREFQNSRKLPPGYDRKCRSLTEEEVESKIAQGMEFTVRLRVPLEGKSVVNDLLRGKIEFDNAKIDDQVLMKSDGMPTYHLANVVDDKLMGITHVVRAEEWIPSTPKHVLLYRAFGWEEPVWVHMPILRNADKSKISKRKNAVSLKHYHDKGYLKEALLNFLALMGWHPKSDEEIFSLDEMIKEFSFDNMHLGGPVFDVKKLNWINREYIKGKSNRELLDLCGIEYSEFKEKIVGEVKESVYTLEELKEKVDFFNADPYENIIRSDNREKMLSIIKDSSTVIDYFRSNLPAVENLDEAKSFIELMKSDLGLSPGKILPAIRVVTIGSLSGVEAAKMLSVFPKDEIVRRVESVLKRVYE